MHFLLKQWCFPQYWQVNIACLGFIIGMRSQQRSKFYTNQGSFVPLASGWIDLLQGATILWNNLFGKTTKFITFASYFVVFDNDAEIRMYCRGKYSNSHIFIHLKINFKKFNMLFYCNIKDDDSDIKIFRFEFKQRFSHQHYGAETQ